MWTELGNTYHHFFLLYLANLFDVSLRVFTVHSGLTSDP